MFYNKPIREKVLQVIEAKISEVEERYKQDIVELEKEFKQREVSLLEKHVESILSKFL